MRKFIAERNLERYRRLLADETDPRRRTVLERLLAEEEDIWAGLSGPEGDEDAPEAPDKKE